MWSLSALTTTDGSGHPPRQIVCRQKRVKKPRVFSCDASRLLLKPRRGPPARPGVGAGESAGPAPAVVYSKRLHKGRRPWISPRKTPPPRVAENLRQVRARAPPLPKFLRGGAGFIPASFLPRASPPIGRRARRDRPPSVPPCKIRCCAALKRAHLVGEFPPFLPRRCPVDFSSLLLSCRCS